jgi:hypothetical protein
MRLSKALEFWITTCITSKLANCIWKKINKGTLNKEEIFN